MFSSIFSKKIIAHMLVLLVTSVIQAAEINKFDNMGQDYIGIIMWNPKTEEEEKEPVHIDSSIAACFNTSESTYHISKELITGFIDSFHNTEEAHYLQKFQHQIFSFETLKRLGDLSWRLAQEKEDKIIISTVDPTKMQEIIDCYFLSLFLYSKKMLNTNFIASGILHQASDLLLKKYYLPLVKGFNVEPESFFLNDLTTQPVQLPSSTNTKSNNNASFFSYLANLQFTKHTK